MENADVRLFVDQPLAEGQSVPLTRAQVLRLFSELRLGVGAGVVLVNGRDGAWRAEVVEARATGGVLRCIRQVGEQRLPPDLWFIFAPIEAARTEFIVEKATEMGAARIIPVQSDLSEPAPLVHDRLQAIAVAAVEQCGGSYVPEVAPLKSLERLLAGWPRSRQLLVCDEVLVGAGEVLAEGPRGASWAILIGPKAGFSATERTRLGALPFVTRISLGPRILRADTAAVAALTLWHLARGDWA